MVGLAARVLVSLAIVPLILSTATIARATQLALADDPPEANLPAPAIGHSFALIRPVPVEPAPSTTKRPAALLPLYVSFAALQFIDLHSTLSALEGGAREGNPVFAGRSPAAMLAVKAGVAVGTTFAVERLRKRSPRTAVVLMIALNSAYAAVVANNYAIALHR
jgi:Domain of unknown function (DUF5658)